MSFEIRAVRMPHEVYAAGRLFAAYAASLPVGLGYQDFDTELAELPGKYAPPDGELLVAWNETDAAIGCIGLRPLIAGVRCEMKRLYVMPEARRTGLGKALTAAIIGIARERGYAELYLDTLPTMATAASLYEQMGFERIAPYYSATPEGTVFMRLPL